MVKKLLLSIFLSVSTVWCFADSVDNPTVFAVYSQNNEYKLTVYPRKSQKQHNLTRKEVKMLSKKIEQGEIAPDTLSIFYFNPCYAVMGQIQGNGSDTIEVWNMPLVNRFSPRAAIVANDGKSVVTFDDHPSRGFRHVVSIYGEKGELIADFSLEDISPFPIEEYTMSISNITWRGRNKYGEWSYGEYLDNDRIVIYFRNEKGEQKDRIFNIKEIAFEDDLEEN